jgi:hypothetical protein
MLNVVKHLIELTSSEQARCIRFFATLRMTILFEIIK